MTAFYYFVDPMCSWCYGFSSEMKKIVAQLPEGVDLHYVMGGLAPDTAEPMPEEVKAYVQSAWRSVAERTGAQFNFDFWAECEPRRSTYPSCRAVIAAGLQGQDKVPIMLEAIQHAYYRQARNPSEPETLIEIAAEIGLDRGQFASDLKSAQVEEQLQAGFDFKDNVGVRGFPTLAVEKEGKFYALAIGYAQAQVVLQRLETIL